MQRLVAAVVVAVRVDLDHQRKTLDSLLRGEVCTQAVDGDEDLPRTQSGEDMFLCSCTGFNLQNHPRQLKILTSEK